MKIFYSITITGVCLAAGTVVTACVSIERAAPPIDAHVLESANVHEREAATLNVGRHLYITACAKCHSARPISEFTRDEWTEILPRMAKKTALSAVEEHAVASYVMTVLDAADRH